MQYKLGWIDEVTLTEIVKKRFAKPKEKNTLSTDPTLNITRRVLMNMHEEEISTIEGIVSGLRPSKIGSVCFIKMCLAL